VTLKEVGADLYNLNLVILFAVAGGILAVFATLSDDGFDLERLFKDELIGIDDLYFYMENNQQYSKIRANAAFVEYTDVDEDIRFCLETGENYLTGVKKDGRWITVS